MSHQNQITEILGAKGVLTEASDMAPYLTDWRARHTGKALLIALPKTTVETAQLVHYCYNNNIPMVPQGGNTGMVQGGVPGTSGEEIVISMKRMNRILDLNTATNVASVEAGVVLETLQNKAMDKDRLFPLSLGAEGSCLIGGNIATNAGGIHVMRYGPMRDLVLGLEVVLANGKIWDGLKALRKDNTGLDLKQLFIGAEGTLGIITGATLKLFPAPKSKATAIIASEKVEGLLSTLSFLQGKFGERLTAFEIFPEGPLAMVLKHIPGARDPFASGHPWYGVIDLWDTEARSDLEENFATALGFALDKNWLKDAVLAKSEAQAKALWLLRETIAEAQKKDGDGIKHDISVPIDKIPEFLERADNAVEKIIPGFKRAAFGHAGDGNIHYDPCPPEGMDQKTFLGLRGQVNRAVHDIVADLNGSISAEHGIGTTRLSELSHYKPEIDLELFRAIKKTLDPKGLMNPGKLIP